MTEPPSTAEAVLVDLLGEPVGAGEVRELAPAAPGLYAWWAAPDVLPALPGPTHPRTPGLRLLYVGVATKLRNRLISNHLGRTGCGTGTGRCTR